MCAREPGDTAAIDLAAYTTSTLPSFARGVPLASDCSSADFVPLLAVNSMIAECRHGNSKSATTRLHTSGTKKSSGVASSSYVNLWQKQGHSQDGVLASLCCNGAKPTASV